MLYTWLDVCIGMIRWRVVHLVDIICTLPACMGDCQHSDSVKALGYLVYFMSCAVLKCRWDFLPAVAQIFRSASGHYPSAWLKIAPIPGQKITLSILKASCWCLALFTFSMVFIDARFIWNHIWCTLLQDFPLHWVFFCLWLAFQ